MEQQEIDHMLLDEQDWNMDESHNHFTKGSNQVETNVATESEDYLHNEKNHAGVISTPNKNIPSMKAPYEGMDFNSCEEAKEYYIEYGRQKGFSVRIRSVNKTRARLDEVTSVYMVCSREGKKEKKDGIDGVDEIGRSCNTIKCGCKAKMRILLNEELNKWTVTIFSDDHNHKFVTPSKRIRLRSNRHMLDAAKDLTEAFNGENLQIGKVPAIFGGTNIGFDKRDCYNHLRKVRYEQALKKIVERKSLEDYVSEHKDRIIDENNLILKHGAKVYTRNIFEKFREELVDSIRFKCEEGERSGDFNTYVVTAKVGYPEQFNLKMKPGTYEGYCECKYFEFIGLPCKHVLRTLNKLVVDEIPPHFI
ncbi:FAR1 DNA binding domain [Macleaya cordata]|uniref:FAR1 DNA binding domain n=1 Tax=Macleaya cordata TaxID=56857 RepID=A0A200QTB8_MACCD|nr:FAR1 DNA binding domain [Macleaya cordata]